MRQKNMFLNIFMVLLVLIAASFVISLFVSVVSGPFYGLRSKF